MNHRERKVTILPGQTLWESLNDQGVAVARTCGGKGICEKCQVEVKGFGKVKSCEFHQAGTYEVKLPAREEFSVVGQEAEVSGMGLLDKVLLIVVDLGTTTVAVKGITSQRTFHGSFMNPQRIYGADVMTRIEAAIKGLGGKLKSEIKTALNNSIARIMQEADWKKEVDVVISGNTTMLHLLRGLSCEGLGKAPFSPVQLELQQEHWKIQGKDCLVTYLPGISAFVGGDIVSGIYGLNLLNKNQISLFLDLGTNGEMALVKDGQILVASAAAGPAFEGTPLALELHAAGIINLLHFMWEENIIDEYGTLCDEYFEDGYPLAEFGEKREGFGQELGIENPSSLRITQEDIRAIQMAKGAIRAGLEILLLEGGITPERLDKLYLAGGMGFYLDAEKAIRIGLLPEGVQEKIEVVGNTSLQGAIQYGKVTTSGTLEEQKEASQMLEAITKQAKEIVLAEHKDFEEKYIENMNFLEKIK